MRLPRGLPLIATLALTATIGAHPPAGAAAAGGPVRLPTGRVATPAGRITPLQSFPTGLAVSPDGHTVLVVAGTIIQGGSPAGPSGGVAIDSVDPNTGQVRQSLNVDDAFQAVVFARSGRRAYVAGGSGANVHTIEIGSDDKLSAGADLPASGLVAGLALSADGRTLWLAEPEGDRVEALDLTGHHRPRAIKAPSPDGLLLSRDGRTLYATAWRSHAVSAIATATGRVRAIRVGSHPSGMALARDGSVVVTDANDATLATIRPGATRAVLTRIALVGRRTDSPNAIAIDPRGRAYVTMGADDAIAVLDPTRGRRARRTPWHLVGLIPTGWYPVAIAIDRRGTRLHTVTARGLAHSSQTTAPYVDPDPASLSPDGAYATAGTLESMRQPGPHSLANYTRRVRHALAPQAPTRPQGNPVLLGPKGPIKHVIYITRENKTYDSELGDLHPGPGNGLVLFGQSVTPNLHALERRYVESQNFTYQGFASVVGHMWEDAGTVSDVFERAVASNTGAHSGHVSDSWHDPTNFPDTGLLTVQAHKAGRTVRTYNQETAQESGLLPARLQAPTSLYPNFDLHIPDTQREAGWRQEFDQFEHHRCTGALAQAYGARCSLPALEYVYLGEDHTTVVDEPGYPTIEAQVADNDLATGRLIEAVSHSPDWRSTAIIVVEDDPQGTGDHRSAYQGYVALASPWAKRGYISLTPYNLTSAVGAIDRILGLPAISDYAMTNRPLDDLFTDHPDFTPYQADTSGAAAYPFVSIPGRSPVSDRAHGVLSFASPDETIPSVSGAATWRQIRHTAPPG